MSEMKLLTRESTAMFAEIVDRGLYGIYYVVNMECHTHTARCCGKTIIDFCQLLFRSGQMIMLEEHLIKEEEES